MFDTVKNWWWQEKSQRYLVLGLLMGLVFVFHKFMSPVLFMLIFSYLGISGARLLQRYLKLPYILAVIIFYLAVIALFVTIVSYLAPMFYEQGEYLYKAVMHSLKDYPHVETYVADYLDKYDIGAKVGEAAQVLLQNSFGVLKGVWTAASEIVLSLFLSFIFALTFNSMRNFGSQFLLSDFPGFFKQIFTLTRKFAYILGQIIEVQIIIDLVNTGIMLVGFSIFGMPSPVVLGMMVFVLGLVPVAGVLISMIPLTIIAYSTGGLWLALEILIFILLVHAFEAYFLHPKLMSSRSELPIFITLTTLIFMESLIGPWGLIIGVPIVSFFLDVTNVHSFSHGKSETVELK
ncbi:MAG: AI-2E family transporter [Lactobacillaceae bacterium]|jgi:predicted PurR-regulated permease PerM|nr:AI-2E family transporter [Lactobacillaceae bacterium]